MIGKPKKTEKSDETMGKSRLRAEAAFTLIELLVVIAIIGILAAIALPQFNAYRRRAYDTDVKINIKNAAVSQESYYTNKETYTSALTDLASWGFQQSVNVNVTPTGAQTTFVVSGGATAGCSSNTGTWSFANSTGITTGALCN